MSNSRSLFLCVLVLWSGTTFFSVPALADDFEDSIERARSRGDITDNEALLFRFYHMTDSDLLPTEFEGGAPLRCGLPVLTEIGEDLSSFPSEVQNRYASMTNRPMHLSSTLTTEHFVIHYSTSDARAPEGWPNRRYLDTVAEAVEECWRFNHETQNWNVPPSDGTAGGGDGLIDLYIDNLGSSLYGYAQIEAASAQEGPQSHTAFFVVDNDYAEFGFADATDAVKVTIAHEYHHVVQMGYSISDSWWMENVSTFIEDEIYDEIDDNYDYLACFLSSPYQALDTRNGCHEYGGFLWPTFLKELFDHDTVRAIEACTAETPLTVCFERELSARGLSFTEALRTFWAWNFYLSIHDDGNHYLEGRDYDRLISYDRAFSSYPQISVGPSETKYPSATGASVLRFNRQSGNQHDIFVLDYDGPRCVQTVTLFQRFPDLRVVEHIIALDENGKASLQIEHWDESLYAYLVTVVPPSCGDGQFDYRINAKTTTHSTSVGPALYTRTVVVDQNVPNPFHRFTEIRYSLGEGGPVQLDIFDVVGRRVRRLVDADLPAGDFVASWDAYDDAGVPVDEGVYFYRVRLGNQIETRKMILVDD